MEYTIVITQHEMKLLAAIKPVVPGEQALALALAKRAHLLDISLKEIRGLGREALIHRILIGSSKA